MHIHHDLAKPPLTLPLYVPADDDDGIAARLDLREVCAASSAELGTLLATPPNVFWSYVLHCAPIMAFVDSYLRFAPRHLGLSSSEAAAWACTPSTAICTSTPSVLSIMLCWMRNAGYRIIGNFLCMRRNSRKLMRPSPSSLPLSGISGFQVPPWNV